jgi:hypothetical protein
VVEGRISLREENGESYDASKVQILKKTCLNCKNTKEKTKQAQRSIPLSRPTCVSVIVYYVFRPGIAATAHPPSPIFYYTCQVLKNAHKWRTVAPPVPH